MDSETATDSSDTDSATTGLIVACTTGGVVLFVSLLVFEVLRRRLPAVYELRRTLVDRQDKESRGYNDEPLGLSEGPSKSPFIGWILSTVNLLPVALEKTHGLDTAFFSRYLRSKVVLHFGLSILSCIVLLPVYYTASNKDLPKGNELRTLGFERFSLGNVPSENTWRFWVSFAGFIVSVFLTIASVIKDFYAFDAARRRYRASKNPSNYTCLLQDIPLEFRTENQIRDFWNGLFPNEVEYVCRAYDAKKLVAKKEKWLDALTRRERAEWEFVNNPKLGGGRPTHKLGACGCCRGDSATVDSIDHWTERQQHYANRINHLQNEMDPKYIRPLQSAIVVFKTKRAASTASQTLFARKPSEWRTCRAPEPKAVNWFALSMSGKSADIRKIISASSIVALSLFWVIPVVFIQGLANLTELAKLELGGERPFRFLDTVIGWSPKLVGIVEGFLPPIIQSVFLSLIPIFIRLLVGISRVVSIGRQDVLVRNWFFEFLFFNGFLFVLVGGSALNSVSELTKLAREADYRGFAEVLAKSVPSQGTFFMTFCIVKALTETPLLLMQLPRVVIRWIFRKFLSKTPRQLDKADLGGSLFQYFRYYALSQLISIIGHVYIAVSPLMSLCVLLYYLMSYLVHTHNIAYNMVPPFGNGGMMFPGALKATLISLVFQGLVMAGLYGLNGQATLSTVTFLFTLVSTVIGYVFIRRRFFLVCEHGSVLETQILDDEESGGKQISPSVARKYLHPGLQRLPEIENLSGVEADNLAAATARSPGKSSKGSPRAHNGKAGADIGKTLHTGQKTVGTTNTNAIEAFDGGVGDEMDRSEQRRSTETEADSGKLVSKDSDSSIYLDARGS